MRLRDSCLGLLVILSAAAACGQDVIYHRITGTKTVPLSSFTANDCAYACSTEEVCVGSCSSITAGDLSCSDCIGGPEIDESTLDESQLDHGSLGGLADGCADHTDLICQDGTRAMTGDLDMGNNAITSATAATISDTSTQTGSGVVAPVQSTITANPASNSSALFEGARFLANSDSAGSVTLSQGVKGALGGGDCSGSATCASVSGLWGEAGVSSPTATGQIVAGLVGKVSGVSGTCDDGSALRLEDVDNNCTNEWGIWQRLGDEPFLLQGWLAVGAPSSLSTNAPERPIDMQDGDGYRGTPQSSPPASAAASDCYYDTEDAEWLCYDGSSWYIESSPEVPLFGDGTHCGTTPTVESINGLSPAPLQTCADNGAAWLGRTVQWVRGYTGGDVYVRFSAVSINATPSGDLEMDCAVECDGDGDTSDPNSGTTQAVSVTFATQYVKETAVSAAITPSGGCVSTGRGDVVSLDIRCTVDATATTATMDDVRIYPISFAYPRQRSDT